MTTLTTLCVLLTASTHAFTLGSAAGGASTPLVRTAVAISPPVMLFGRKPAAAEPTLQNARDADFARRQERLAGRKATGAATPKGQVEVTFPQKGGKVVKAMQGDALGAVCKKAGVRIKFDCKNGRCGTCQVRINGRSAAKVCQGAKVPGGATRKITLTLDNP